MEVWDDPLSKAPVLGSFDKMIEYGGILIAAEAMKEGTASVELEDQVYGFLDFSRREKEKGWKAQPA